MNGWHPENARMTSTAAPHPAVPLTVRPATDADATALRDLAALDSAKPLAGPVVVAERDGTLVAAVSLADDRAVADPLAPTAAVVELVRAYAARSTGAAERTGTRRSPWRRPAQRRHAHAVA